MNSSRTHSDSRMDDVAVLRRVEPSRSLFDTNKETRHPYVHSIHTDIRARFAEWRQLHSRPETDESYAADQMAEHSGLRIPGNY